MIRVSSIRPQGPVKYLWHDRFPIGAISVLAGIEGTGKSTLSAAIAAAASRRPAHTGGPGSRPSAHLRVRVLGRRLGRVERVRLIPDRLACVVDDA